MSTQGQLAAIMAQPVPTVDELTTWVQALEIKESSKKELLADCLMRRDLQLEFREYIRRLVDGEEGATYDDMGVMLARVASAHGFEGGLPLPAVNAHTAEVEHPLVMAHNAPMGISLNAAYHTEQAQQLARSWRRAVRNSWERLGDESVSVVDSEDGPCAIVEPAAGRRLRKLLDEIGIRSDVATMTAEAELRALDSLKARVTGNQYRTYVLSGAFVEPSKRSDLTYVFRKGRPILVMSWHAEELGKCIAALCFHPTGYYQFSHVGVMAPTDEVIAGLVMMRGDEHRLWKKSGQWQASDSRAGL